MKAESLKVFMIGGAFAALSGGSSSGSWARGRRGAWETPETFLYFAAMIVGGPGNNLGALIGAALVLGVFKEVVRIPAEHRLCQPRRGGPVHVHRAAHPAVPVLPSSRARCPSAAGDSGDP